jgi:aerobic carbon-monoxide dehydrogenase medium subunit
VHPFDYAAPAGIEEALALLAQHGGEAKVLAGGQSLVPLLNYRLAKPRLLIDINALGLGGVEFGDNAVRLGALVRYHVLEESPEMARACPLLGAAARLIGNVRVRSLGTVGGSLAHADPAGELPLVMVALDAHMTAHSAAGTRRIPARAFFTGYLSTSLEPNELLTEIEVPSTAGKGTAVEEMARRAGDFAMIATAVVVSVDRSGRVDEARVAYAGVGPQPLRAQGAEEVLVGHEPTSERVRLAARTARQTVPTHSDAFVSSAYRSVLVEVLGRRALERAVGRALAAP